jgi:hypothetical protein
VDAEELKAWLLEHEEMLSTEEIVKKWDGKWLSPTFKRITD